MSMNAEAVPLVPQAVAARKTRLWVIVGAVVALVLIAVFAVPSVVLLNSPKPGNAPAPITSPTAPVDEEFGNITFVGGDPSILALPCISGRNFAGCANRIYEIACTDTSDAPNIGHSASARCASIASGSVRKVRFQIGKDEGSKTKCYQVTAAVGECWGTHPGNGGSYDCMGRCGASCGGLPGGWSENCFKHDICSWFFSASGGTNDNNCGLTFKHASNDLFCSGTSTNCVPSP